jgi:glutathione S-transferase
MAILEYLEETHPRPALLPADAIGRARVRALSLIWAADHHPLIVPRVRLYLRDQFGVDEAGRIVEACIQIDAVARALPLRQPGAPASH